MRLTCLPAMIQDKEEQDLHPTQASGTVYLTQTFSILKASADRHLMVSDAVKKEQDLLSKRHVCWQALRSLAFVQRSCSGTYSCRKVLCRIEESMLL